MKVQNIPQADRIRHVFINSMCYYDSSLLHKSNLIEIISYLRVGPTSAQQPLKVVLDKAHGQDNEKQLVSSASEIQASHAIGGL